MGDTVNLTALAATRGKMTDHGEWRQGHVDKHQVLVRDGESLGGPVLGDRVVAQANTNFQYVENIAGIVATHNAGDALIEVARTLLVYNAAKREAARVRELWSRDWNNNALQSAHQVVDRALLLSKADHAAALAKVSL